MKSMQEQLQTQEIIVKANGNRVRHTWNLIKTIENRCRTNRKFRTRLGTRFHLYQIILKHDEDLATSIEDHMQTLHNKRRTSVHIMTFSNTLKRLRHPTYTPKATPIANASHHIPYNNTTWAQVASLHCRSRDCPNFSSRPDTDSARQKVGQANCVSWNIMFLHMRHWIIDHWHGMVHTDSCSAATTSLTAPTSLGLHAKPAAC